MTEVDMNGGHGDLLSFLSVSILLLAEVNLVNLLIATICAVVILGVIRLEDK